LALLILKILSIRIGPFLQFFKVHKFEYAKNPPLEGREAFHKFEYVKNPPLEGREAFHKFKYAKNPSFGGQGGCPFLLPYYICWHFGINAIIACLQNVYPIPLSYSAFAPQGPSFPLL